MLDASSETGAASSPATTKSDSAKPVEAAAGGAAGTDKAAVEKAAVTIPVETP